MKKGLGAVALALMLLLSWVIPANAAWGWGGGSWGSTYGTSFFYKIGSGTVTADLIAGKTTGDVGSVIVWETVAGTVRTINVRYDVNVGWNLTDTALAIGRGSTSDRAESKIPQKNGNYTPDKFPYKDNLDTYSILESTISGTGNWFCIAAYAELQKNGDTSKTYKAWGDLSPVGKWKLPTTPVTLETLDYGTTHYVNVQLSNVGTGFSIQNGEVYGAWCADPDKIIDVGELYDNVHVYSSLNLSNPNIPDYLKNYTDPSGQKWPIKWDMINYIINHHDPDASWVDVELAIVYFTNQAYPTTDFPIAIALVEDALAHGAGFKPGAGQIGAIILDPGNDLQPLFIELWAPTGCYKETSCHHDCTPNWNPCQQNWEPIKWSNSHWNPCGTNNHNWSSNWGHNNWGSNCTPQQNFNHFKNIWHKK